MTTPFSHDRITVDQLDRYFRGESAPDEHAVVQAWVLAHPEAKAFVERVRQAAASEDLEAAWAAVAGRVWDKEARGAERAVVSGAAGERGRALRTWIQPTRLFLSGMVAARTRALWVLGVAAVLVLTIGRWSHLARLPRASTFAYATDTAKVGQVAHLTLADGSQVTLAPRSRLTIAEHFGSETRDVTLVGEAYFVVQSALRVPFVVHTGPVSTRVLGTAFDVRRFADDRTTHVAVVSGRVATGGHATSAVLAAGSVGQVTDSTVVVNAADDPSAAVAWTQGRLVFNDTPVSVVLATLGRWYGYEFRLTDTVLAANHVSMTFKTNAPIETMNVVKALLGVTMTFDGNVVVLRPKQGSASISQPKSTRELLKNPKPEVGR